MWQNVAKCGKMLPVFMLFTNHKKNRQVSEIYRIYKSSTGKLCWFRKTTILLIIAQLKDLIGIEYLICTSMSLTKHQNHHDTKNLLKVQIILTLALFSHLFHRQYFHHRTYPPHLHHPYHWHYPIDHLFEFLF